MIVLVCNLAICDNNRFSFDSPEEAAKFLRKFLPIDFGLEIDDVIYDWPTIFYSDVPTGITLDQEYDMVLDHLKWCIEITESFYYD